MTVSANQIANWMIASIEAPLAKTVLPATATRMPGAAARCSGDEESAHVRLLNGISRTAYLRRCTRSLRNWPRRPRLLLGRYPAGHLEHSRALRGTVRYQGKTRR